MRKEVLEFGGQRRKLKIVENGIVTKKKSIAAGQVT